MRIRALVRVTFLQNFFNRLQQDARFDWFPDADGAGVADVFVGRGVVDGDEAIQQLRTNPGEGLQKHFRWHVRAGEIANDDIKVTLEQLLDGSGGIGHRGDLKKVQVQDVVDLGNGFRIILNQQDTFEQSAAIECFLHGQLDEFIYG